jgi:hypothetical protein
VGRPSHVDEMAALLVLTCFVPLYDHPAAAAPKHITATRNPQLARFDQLLKRFGDCPRIPVSASTGAIARVMRFGIEC